MSVERCVGVIQRMAVNATRGSRRAQRMTHPMDAGGIFFRLSFVAAGAIDRLYGKIVVRMFSREIRMATRTRIGFMDRTQEPRLINKQRNRHPCGVCFEKCVIRMAFQTGAVGEGRS